MIVIGTRRVTLIFSGICLITKLLSGADTDVEFYEDQKGIYSDEEMGQGNITIPEDDLKELGLEDPDPPLTIVLPPIEPGQEPTLSINIPVIGRVKMIFQADGTAVGRFADSKKKFQKGPFIFDKGELVLYPGNTLSLLANGSCFGAKVRFGLKEYGQEPDPQNPEVVLKYFRVGVTYITKPTIFIAGKKVTLDETDIIFVKNKSTKSLSRATFLGTPAELITDFQKDEKTLDVLMRVPKLKLSSIMPGVNKTPLKEVFIQNAQLTLADYVSSDVRPYTTVISGTADLSGLMSLITKNSATAVHVKILMNPARGDQLNARLENFVIPNFGEFKNVELTAISRAPKSDLAESVSKIKQELLETYNAKNNVSMFFAATAVIGARGETMPPFTADTRIVVGEKDIVQDVKKDLLTGEKVAVAEKEGTKKVGDQIITVGDPEAITVYFKGTGSGKNITVGVLKLQDVEGRFYSSPKAAVTDFTLVGSGTVSGHEARISIGIDNSGSYEGIARLDKTLTPFSGIPGLEKITFSNARMEISNKSEKSSSRSRVGQQKQVGTTAELTGVVHVWDVDLPGLLETRMIPNQETLVRLRVSLPDPEKVPVIKNMIAKDITVQELELVIANRAYKDPDLNREMQRGMYLKGKLLLTGPLAGVGRLSKLAGSNPETPVSFFAIIDPAMPSKTELGISIPSDIRFNKQVTLKNLFVYIGGGVPPKVRLEGLLEFVAGRDILLFTVSGGMSPLVLELSGSMQGAWRRPLGISGVTLSNLGLTFGVNAQTMGPTQFGITGELKVGSKIMKIAGIADAVDPTNMGFVGELNSLSLQDLAELAVVVGAPQAIRRGVPDLKIKDLKLKIAPAGLKIGSIEFEKGMEFYGGVSILGTTGNIGGSISESGITGSGTLSKIEAGPFKLTGSKGAGDPSIELSVSTTPRLAVTGLLQLGALLKADTRVDLSNGVAKFDFDYAVGVAKRGNISVKVKGTLGTLTLLNLGERDLEIIFSNTFMQYIKDRAVSGLEKASEAIDKGVSKAQQDVQSLNNQIAAIDRQISRKQEEIRTMDAANKKDIDTARNKVAAAEQSLNRLRREIADLDRWYNGLPAI
mgnify:CR=1 FL=1